MNGGAGAEHAGGPGARAVELYYQPQVDNGRITGAEALLRWRHPRDGFVARPVHPAGGGVGLILPIGEWALQTACERLALMGAAAGSGRAEPWR